MTGARRPFPWLLLVLAWFVLAGFRPLLEPDEGRYAEIPREMLATGDWVTPHLNGIQYLEKPPLQYWATAVAYSVFGVHEGSARLWAVTLSFLTIPLVFLAGARLYGSYEAGQAAATVLATSPFFVLVGQLNLLDGAFTFFLTAAVFAFLFAQREPEKNAHERRWMLLAWAALALAVLSKGIVALVLTGATLMLYSVAARNFSLWRRLQLLPGLALFAAMVVPWFWLAAARNPEFLHFFFIREHFQRFLTTVHDRAEPWWFFLPILLLGVAPWIGRLPAALRSAWRDKQTQAGLRPRQFLVLWCLVVVGFFSASGSKLTAYVLPCMPIVAVLLAPRIVARPRSVFWAAVTTLILVVLFGVALAVAANRRAPVGVEIPMQFVAWSGIAVAAAAAAVLMYLRGSASVPMPALAASSVLAWQSLLMAYSVLPPLHTAKDLVAAVRADIRPSTALYSVGQYRQSVPPYLGRTLRIAAYTGELEFGLEHSQLPRLKTLDEFAAQWRRETDAVAFMAPEYYAKLAATGLPGRVLARDGRSIVVARQ